MRVIVKSPNLNTRGKILPLHILYLSHSLSPLIHLFPPSLHPSPYFALLLVINPSFLLPLLVPPLYFSVFPTSSCPVPFPLLLPLPISPPLVFQSLIFHFLQLTVLYFSSGRLSRPSMLCSSLINFPRLFFSSSQKIPPPNFPPVLLSFYTFLPFLYFFLSFNFFPPLPSTILLIFPRLFLPSFRFCQFPSIFPSLLFAVFFPSTTKNTGQIFASIISGNKTGNPPQF
jgi:hypothetical protein